MGMDYSGFDSLPQTLGGTASASSSYNASRGAGSAFNGILSPEGDGRMWHARGNTGEWIEFRFDEKQLVKSYRIYPYINTSRNYDLKSWDFQGLDDNGNWITLDSRENETFVRFEWKSYSTYNNDLYIAYRLYVHEGSSNNPVIITEFEMYKEQEYMESYALSHGGKIMMTSSSTSDSLPQTLGGIATASKEFSASYQANQAFNGNLSDYFASGTRANEWIAFTFTDKQIITSYKIYAHPNLAYNIKTWDFQGLSDNGEWVTLDSRENESFVQGQWNEYRFEGGYSFIAYRLYIYESNGSNIRINQIEMYNEDRILTVAPQSMQDELLVSQLRNYTEPKDPINLKQGINKINYINNEPAPLGDGVVFEQEIDVPIQKLEVK